MENKKDFGKFIQLTKVLHILTKVLNIVAIVAGSITLTAAVLLSLFSSQLSGLIDANLPKVGDLSMQFGELNYTFNPGVIPGSKIIWFAIIMLIVATLSLAAFYFVTRSLKVILSNVVAKNPFSEDSVKHVRYLGYWIIGSSFVTGVRSLAMFALMKAMDLERILSSAGMFNLNTSIDLVDTGLLFVGLLILLLSSIFQYGNFLQEEFDATV